MKLFNNMKTILVAVMSIDGKMTKWGNPQIHEWTSREDQSYFQSIIDQAKVVIMGRKTYEHAKSMMKHHEHRLRIVFTRHPERFKHEEIAGQLEFMNKTPQEIMYNLKQVKDIDEVFLFGGGEINTLFLEANLVDELWLTIEPKIFGEGNGLANLNLDNDFKLFEHKQLNEQGTILLKYKQMDSASPE